MGTRWEPKVPLPSQKNVRSTGVPALDPMRSATAELVCQSSANAIAEPPALSGVDATDGQLLLQPRRQLRRTDEEKVSRITFLGTARLQGRRHA